MGLTIGCLIALLHDAGWTTRWDHPLQDLAFRLRPERPDSGAVVVVGITADCIEELGPTPWPRRWYGEAIQQLNAKGASVIALDVFFPDPSHDNRIADGEKGPVDDDGALADAMREAGNVILPVFDQYRGSRKNIIRLRQNISRLTEAAATVGHINVVQDSDGVVRRTPVRIGSLTRRYLQLGVVAAGLHAGVRDLQPRYGRGVVVLGGWHVPVDEQGNMLINWQSPDAWDTPGRLLTFSDLRNGRVTDEQIRGKIVLLGQTSPGLPNADQIATPFGPRYGLFAQGNIAEGIASERYVYPCPRIPYLVLLLGLSAIAGAALPNLKLVSLLVSAAALLAAAGATGFLALSRWEMLLDVMPLVLSVALTTGGTLAWSLAGARGQVRRQEEALEVLRVAGEETAGLIANALSGDAADIGVLGATGPYAESLQVPQITPPMVLRSMAAGLGARYGFMRLDDGRGPARWLSTASPDDMAAGEVRRLAEAVVPLVEREGQAVLVPRTRRHPALSPFSHLAKSVLGLRLALGECALATVVLCGKTRTAISPAIHFGITDLRIACAMAPQGSLLLDHARLHQTLRSLLARAVGTLTAAVHARDAYTRGHSERVAFYAVFLARATGLSDEAVEAIELGALLHDVGKIGMDEGLLKGKRGLNQQEWALIKQHPVIGSEIIAGLEELSFLVPAVRHHHERYDGTGYPDGLRGEEIALVARIMAVADAFDAMTFERTYRDAPLVFEEACAELDSGAGSQFDPQLAAVFVKHAGPELIAEAQAAATEDPDAALEPTGTAFRRESARLPH